MGVLAAIRDLAFGFIDEAEERVGNLVEALEGAATSVVNGVVAAFQTLLVGLIKTSAALAQLFIETTFATIRAATTALLGSDD